MRLSTTSIAIILLSFTLLPEAARGAIIQIGSGALTSSASGVTPFSTLYEDGRHQYIILASQLTAAGAIAGPITSLGFNVSSAGSPPMSNFNISLGATSATSLSGMASGLSNYYSGIYSPSTGWNTFTFSSSFMWNGTSNILVEVCYNNTTWSTNSSVFTYSVASGRTYGLYDDGTTGCSMTTGNGGAQAEMPQMQLNATTSGGPLCAVGSVVNIASLPYSVTGATTCGAGNDVNATVTCGSSSYLGGEDQIYVFTPTTTGSYTIALTSSSSWVGLMLYSGCPTTGTCVGSAQSSSGNQTLAPTLTAGTTYYLIVDTWPSPTCIPSYNLSITGAADPCSSIATITCGTPTTVTLSGSGVWDFSGTLPTNSCGYSTPGQEKIYSFTPTVSGLHTLQVTSGSGYIDYFWKAASGGCGSTGWTCIDDIASTGSMPFGPLTAGTQYYILLDDEDVLSTTHTFQIVCPSPAPANDNCASAVSLTPGAVGAACSPTSGTTVNATQSIAAIVCGSFAGTSDDDVWYSFVATATSHTVTVVGSGLFDAVVDVRSGSCNGTNINCADGMTGGGTEIVNLSGLTVGATYLVRVYSYGSLSSNQGTFSICVTTPFDPCSSITTLACATPTTVTLSGAGVWSPSISCGFSTPGQEKLYSFTPTVTGAHSLQVTSTDGTYIDYFWKAASGGCGSTGWTCINDISIPQTTAIGTLTAGTQYYILLDDESNVSSTHTFQIVCPPPAPANDNCASAVTLTPGAAGAACSPTSGTTVSATSSGVTGCGGTPDDDVWYQFTATATAHTVTVAGGSGFDAVIDVRTGACNGTNLMCADGTGIGGTETLNLTGLTVGSTYLVRVYDYYTATPGTFTICVTTPFDPCSNITTLACATPTTVTLSGAGVWNPTTSCGFSTVGMEKVYSFTPTVTGVHSLQVTATDGTYIDYFWKAASGGCGSTGWTCINDINSTITETIGALTAGTQYYILLDDENAISTTHTFQIVCPPPGPVNDDCSNATTLTAGSPGAACSTTSGTTVGATQSIPAITCTFTGSADDDVWYSFVATATSHTVTVVGSGLFDAVVDVRSGSCNGTNINCADGMTSGTEIVNLSGLTVGATYLVRVYSYGSFSQGTFNICVTTPSPAPPCVGAPTSPANGAGGICPGPVTLSWPSAVGATSYDVYFGTSSTPPFVSNVTGTSYSTGTLTSGTYYWQILPRNASGAATGCTIWSFTIGDTEAPSITCPGSQTLNNTPGQCAATATYTAPTGTDNCPGATTTLVAGLASGSLFPVGTTTNVFRVTASNGQSSTCSFTITVNDTEAPSIACPGSQTLSNTPGQCGATATYTAPTGTDNCPGATTAQIAGLASGSLFPVGATTNTFRVTAANGQSSTCSFTITVNDTEAPSIACPGSQTLNNTPGQCGATATYTAPTGTDNCPGATTAQIAGLASGSLFPVGATTNTFRVTAANGQSSSCSFTITVNDTEAPSIACPGSQTLNNTPGQCGATATYTAPTGTDNCPGATTAQIAGLASGSLFPVGATTNTFRVTASNGQSSSCSFTITVNDTEAPSITCPGSQTLSNTPGVCGATATYTAPTGTDNCPGATTAQIAGLASGSLFPVGTTTNTFRVTAANGQSSSCSFTITVNDTQAPTITCPLKQNLTAQAGVCGATTTYTTPTGSDNCAGVSVTQIGGLASGSLFPVGVTNNIWRATDASGNTATCSFSITVTDNQLPAISCPASISTGTDPGECSAVEVYNTPTASDNCPGVSVIQIGGQASGSAFPLGTTTNVFRATDASGNITTCSFTVVVTDTEFPTLSCPAAIVRSSAFNECGRAITNLGQASASDNCPGLTLTNDSPGYFPVGTTTVTYEVSDAAGHTASCEQTVTVNDVQGPTISCPTIVVETDAGDCVGTVDYEATASDNCPGVAITYSQASPATFGIGHSVVMAVATDASGHTAQCAIGIQVNPREELCNGVDDDCDDLIDESEGWLRVAKRVAKDALEGDEYGISVDIDGDWAIAGSTRGAYLFQRENGVWQAGVRLHELISVPAGSGFGHSVGIDGGTVAVGAPSDSESGTDAGAVYIFEYDGTAWALVKKVVSGDADSGDKLGWSASLDGGRLLTGAPGDDESGSESGAGYIFSRNTGGPNNWGEVKKLAVVGLGAGDGFGHSVALHGTFAAVGAPYDDDLGTDAGAVYRFGKDQGGVDTWGQTGALLGNPTQAGDHFGWSVAVWGASTLVGAPGSDVQGMDAGAAFAFQNNSQVVMLTNFYVEDGAGYGSGVALDGDYAVVTAPGDDPNGSGSGKGFVYLVAGQLWALVGELADGSPSIGDGLGSAVAMSDRTVMTGSPLDDTGVMDDHGSVLFFEGLCADEQTRPREGAVDNALTVSCYPVPFSASLNVAVQTKEGEEVQVTILNLLGQEVARLTPQVSTGEQQLFIWPSGRAQAGVYLVRVQAGERIQTQSVILQRP